MLLLHSFAGVEFVIVETIFWAVVTTNIQLPLNCSSTALQFQALYLMAYLFWAAAPRPK